MDINKLSEIANISFDKEHKCKENIFSKDIKILHSVEGSGSWQLYNLHFASKEEVQMKEADFEGELVSQTMFIVCFCPFCGEKLIT